MPDIHPDDYNELWEERAAIMEYCGGLPRAEAEYRARRCLDSLINSSRENKNSPAEQAAHTAISEARRILSGIK